MSKELTPLEWFYYYKNKLQHSGTTIRPNGFDIVETALKDYENILKALIIIEKKRVSIEWLMNVENVETYNAYYDDLTQEEYNLLKEVL